ncbi:helix-turn-helix domain-containing protein [Streptomyces afghaniensis]|uniref:helix-turn-helix domain-containing protein n=1 Tax=Streptomyces afghaniensis TaxID=66865 RepID=UPI0033B2574B
MARGSAHMFSGARLRQARSETAAGALSAEELAERVGASKAQILAYENGQRVPDPPRIRQLADALGIHPLVLANQSGRRSWQLADLRRANGLRASDLCSNLGLKPHSYRRLETSGLTADGRYGLSQRLAVALGVSMRALERHVSNAPAVRQRLDSIRCPLTALIEGHLEPGRTSGPEATDPAVKEIAACYTRSVTTVARLLSQEVLTVREMRRRQAILAATAFYGPTAEEQQRARRRMEGEEARINQLISSLPRRLDSFFRAQLAPASWETLSQLHLAGTNERALTMIAPAVAQDSTLGPLIRPLARRTTGPGLGLYDISREGQRHYLSFKHWYDALYPWVDDNLRHFRQQTAVSEPPELPWLRQCFAQSQTILFSFDGILCRLFADNVRSVSSHLVQAASSLQLDADAGGSADPVALLRSVVDSGSPEQVRQLDSLLTTYETAAARRAEPLPGAAQLLGALSRGPWRLAVVTDHATAAVQTFLTHLHPDNGGTPQLGVFGRPHDPRLMKPHPHAIFLATNRLGGDRSRTLLIGESLADALAARAAGVQFIGVAAQQSHARRLKEAGAVNVVETLTTLLAAVSRIKSAHRDEQSSFTPGLQ